MGQEGRKIYTCLRAPKAAAIAGILFAILIFISIVLLLTAMPEKSGDNLAWLTKHRNNLLLSFNLNPLCWDCVPVVYGGRARLPGRK
jgi:hypothetical protein